MISILNRFKVAAFLATGLFFLTLRIKEEKCQNFCIFTQSFALFLGLY